MPGEVIMTSKPYIPPRVDRTEEFFRCVELFSEGKVVPKRYNGRHEAKGLMLDAENLNRQINFIDGQLQKLGKLVHKKGMFDNTTKEVNDLTALCKAQLERCNKDLKTLQQHGTVNVNQTTAQHFKILVDSLRRRLSDHGKKFKELLESRSEVLKRQHKRRQNFASNDVAVAQLPPSAQSTNSATQNHLDGSRDAAPASLGAGLRQRASVRQSNLNRRHGDVGRPGDGENKKSRNEKVSSSTTDRQNPYRSSAHNSRQRLPHHNPYMSSGGYAPVNPYINSGGGQPSSQNNTHATSISVNNYQAGYHSDFQTQQYYFKNDTSQRRSEAVQAAKTISTISSMWSQMTSLIAQQDEMLPSIEDNVFQAEVHINKGQNELLKYWQTVSSERALILKLFGVLLLIIFVFTYMRS